MKYFNRVTNPPQLPLIALTKCLLLGILLLNAQFVIANEVNVAVAGNFFKPLKILAAKFETQSTHKIILSVASTGKLYAQINNGAPFDVFFAADQKRPSKLVEKELAVKDSQFTYARGKLVLWSSDPNLIDSQGKWLFSSNLKHLAIANPKTAPYGEQAIVALKNLKLYDQLEDGLVQGQNVSQAFQYVSSGNVQQGIIALSQVTEDSKLTSGSAWVIPNNLYQTIQQDVVLLTKGEHNLGAIEFLAYIKSLEAIKVIRSFGYKVGP